MPDRWIGVSTVKKVGDDIGSAGFLVFFASSGFFASPALQLPGTPAVWPQLPGALLDRDFFYALSS